MAQKARFEAGRLLSRSALHEIHYFRLHVGLVMVMRCHDEGRASANEQFSSRPGQTDSAHTPGKKCVQKNGYFILYNHKVERTKLHTKNQTEPTIYNHDHHLNDPPRNARHSGSTQSRDAVGRSTRTAARRRRRAQCASSAGTRCTRPRAPRRASRQAAPPRSSAPPGRHGRASTSAARSGPWATRGSSAGHRAGSPHSPVSSSTTRTEPL